MKRLFKRKDKTLEELKGVKGYNPYFLNEIQPQGGISFKEDLVRKGDGYETSIYVYAYPTGVINNFWLERIMNMENVIATLDIANEERSKVIADMNSSLIEQESRIFGEKDTIGQIDARNEYQSLQQLYNEISQAGESIKYIKIRLHLAERTIKELEKRVKGVLVELESLGYRGAVLLNESEFEWKSLHLSATQQMKLPNARKGKAVQSLALAGGYPFHFTHLSDDCGTFLGTTFTRGNVLFDMFHKDKHRRFVTT